MNERNYSHEARRFPMIAAIATGLVGLAIGQTIASGSASPNNEPQEIIRVRRIEIVDEAGHTRLVLAAPLGNPVIGGRELPRSGKVHGIQLLDPDGNEIGGLGMTDNGNAAMLCFDHATAEAVCITRYGSSVGLSIFDRAAPGAKVGVTGKPRFSLGTDQNGQSSLTMFDRDGKKRFNVSIDTEGEIHFSIIGADGKPILDLPKQSNKRGD